MFDIAILILRFFLGVIMIPHGIHKFEKLALFNKKWLVEYGFPAGSVALTGLVQIAGGLAMILGIYSRAAAFVLVLSMVIATYVSIWKHHEPFLSTPEGKGWDINFLLIGSFIALILFGDGKWALLGY
jgi:putative oxidoreductase